MLQGKFKVETVLFKLNYDDLKPSGKRVNLR